MPAARRLSCPYDGVRPPNVIERATALGIELGPVVVVIVGYNDYEANYAMNIEQALAVFRTAGVERVLWATLRASRQSYASMNDMIRDAARRHPGDDGARLERALARRSRTGSSQTGST